MPTASPTFASRPRLLDFFSGLALPLKAAGLLFRSGRLFLLSTLAAAVTLASMVGQWILLRAYLGKCLSHFWPEPAGGFAHLGWLAVYLAAFVLLLIAGINTVPLLVLAPLQDPLSEAAERAVNGSEPPPFSLARFLRSLWVGVVHNGVRIALLLLGQLLLLALWVSPVTAGAWTFLSAGWTAIWLSGEYLSGPMARHLYPFRAVLAALWARKALTVGFGTALYLLFWIPVLNLFFIPLGGVAGTLLYAGLLESGTIPPPPA